MTRSLQNNATRLSEVQSAVAAFTLLTTCLNATGCMFNECTECPLMQLSEEAGAKNRWMCTHLHIQTHSVLFTATSQVALHHTVCTTKYENQEGIH